MAMQPQVKHVVKGSAREGRCRDCGRRIVWAKVAPKGKSFPFDREPIYAPDVTNDGGVKFEVWPNELLHFISCPARKRHAALSGVRA